MRFNQLRDFVAVIEAGSMRAAARNLGVSQPAMTNSIRSLEEELHVQLVQRTTRGVVPTRAGKVYLARARVIQAEARKAEEELAQLAGGSGGRVAIGGSPPMMLVLPDALVAFRRQFPAAHVRVVEGPPHALVPLLREETLDFVFGPKRREALDGGIRFRPLLRAPLAVTVRRGHPLRTARSLRELADASWLVYALGERGGRIQEALAGAGVTLRRPIVHCESFGGTLTLLAKSDSVTMLPRLLTADPVLRGLLQEIEVAEALPALTLGLYLRADSPLTPAASAMARVVTAAARRFTRAT